MYIPVFKGDVVAQAQFAAEAQVTLPHHSSDVGIWTNRAHGGSMLAQVLPYVAFPLCKCAVKVTLTSRYGRRTQCANTTLPSIHDTFLCSRSNALGRLCVGQGWLHPTYMQLRLLHACDLSQQAQCSEILHLAVLGRVQ